MPTDGRPRRGVPAIAALVIGLAAPAVAEEPVAPDAFLAADCLPQACRTAAARFRTDWAAAHAGDYRAQRAVALCLVSGCAGAVAIDRPHGCAWRLLLVNRFAGGNDEQGFRAGDTIDSAILDTQALCAGLRAAEAERAVGLARGLTRAVQGRELLGTVADVVRRRRP